MSTTPRPPRVVCFGPGPRFKGGIANYNTSLAKALADQGAEVHIVSWTQQYPAIIPRDFIDRKSRTNQLAGTGIRVQYMTNYNRPGSWGKTVRAIKALQPDVVIFQWAIALQGYPLGRMARALQKQAGIEVMFDVHLVVQKEASALDRHATKYGLKVADSYIVHSEKTLQELRAAFPKLAFEGVQADEKRDRLKATPGSTRPVLSLFHPVYDMFQPEAGFDVAAAKAELGLKRYVFLFFGFIRKYKGLHWCLEAFAELLKRRPELRDEVSLLIVGESFWDTLDAKKWTTRLKKALFGTAKKLLLRKASNEQDYRPLALIDSLGLRQNTVVVNEFVPNEAVPRYFQVADAILLLYETATPSGVESMAYNFNLPVVASRVGHFPETVQDGYNGYLAAPGNTPDMARALLQSIEMPIDRTNVAATAAGMSWARYAGAVLRPYR